MCHNENLKVLDIHGEKYSFNYQLELWPDFGSWIDDLSISDTPEVTCQTWLFIISVAWKVSQGKVSTISFFFRKRWMQNYSDGGSLELQSRSV